MPSRSGRSAPSAAAASALTPPSPRCPTRDVTELGGPRVKRWRRMVVDGAVRVAGVEHHGSHSSASCSRERNTVLAAVPSGVNCRARVERAAAQWRSRGAQLLARAIRVGRGRCPRAGRAAIGTRARRGRDRRDAGRRARGAWDRSARWRARGSLAGVAAPARIELVPYARADRPRHHVGGDRRDLVVAERDMEQHFVRGRVRQRPRRHVLSWPAKNASARWTNAVTVSARSSPCCSA
jgi:hypothetical protein